MTRGRKAAVLLLFLLGIGAFVLAHVFLWKSVSAAGLEQVRDGETPFRRFVPAYVLAAGGLLTAAGAFLCMRAAANDPDRKRSWNAVLRFGLILPLEFVLFTAYRTVMILNNSVSAKAMREIFYNNGGTLQIVAEALTAAVGIIVVSFVRSGEYVSPVSREKAEKIRAGVLGALNADGAPISDAIVTRYDGRDVLILVFDSAEEFDSAVETRYTEVIRQKVGEIEPGYEVRFEAPEETPPR